MRARSAVAVLAAISAMAVAAAEHKGVVRFGGLPLPGATVRAEQGSRTFLATTDAEGQYTIPELGDGTMTVEVSMQLFQTEQRTIALPSDGPTAWHLQLLAAEKIQALALSSEAPQARAAA